MLVMTRSAAETGEWWPKFARSAAYSVRIVSFKVHTVISELFHLESKVPSNAEACDDLHMVLSRAKL